MSEISLNDLSLSLGIKQMPEERMTRFLDAVLEGIDEAVSSGKDVSFSGFGDFSLATLTGNPLPALSKVNIVREVSSKLGEDNENRVNAVLENIVEGVKNELLDGRKVLLNGLGSMELSFAAPRIERQPKGHRLIKPALSTLEFASPKVVQTPAGEGKIVFEPTDDFRKKVESTRQSTIMLIVPERDFFVKTLEYYFEAAGWDIEVCENVDDALKKIESGKAYLSILDALMEGSQKFCYNLKIRRETNRVPLILLHPGEGVEEVTDGVTIEGDSNLVQPFEFRELLDIGDQEILRSAEERLIFRQQINFSLATDEANIEKVIEHCHKLLEQSGMNEEGQVAMGAAFREGVVNAAQHGNKYKKDKKIHVQYLLDSKKITVVIR
ncbi:MAG: HU family DNA-binding protein, partial [Planctomycetota bacterium]|nr:HU family DNA-binding protein [Planctomycetota bacterium]